MSGVISSDPLQTNQIMFDLPLHLRNQEFLIGKHPILISPDRKIYTASSPLQAFHLYVHL